MIANSAAAVLVIDGTPQNDEHRANVFNRFGSSVRQRQLGILEAPDDHGNRTVRLSTPENRQQAIELASEFGLKVIR